MTATCLNCGHANSQDAQFCSSCGSPLTEGAEEQPVEASEHALDGIPPRDLGQLISDTFSVYGANFWPLFVMALIPNVPLAISGYMSSLLDAIFILVGILLLVLQAGAFVCWVAGHYASREVDVLECYRAAWRRVLSLAGATILILLALVVSMILWVILIGIPLFFYLLVIWFFADEAIMIERKAAVAALGRSRELVRGSWWRVFGIGVTFVGIILGLFLVGLIPSVIVWNINEDLGNILLTVVSVLVAPIFFVGRTLVYLDLRARKEGYSLEALASDIGR